MKYRQIQCKLPIGPLSPEVRNDMDTPSQKYVSKAATYANLMTARKEFAIYGDVLRDVLRCDAVMYIVLWHNVL